MTRYLQPVWGFGTPQVLAVFFEYADALEFIRDAANEHPVLSFEQRTLFMGELMDNASKYAPPYTPVRFDTDPGTQWERFAA